MSSSTGKDEFAIGNEELRVGEDSPPPEVAKDELTLVALDRHGRPVFFRSTLFQILVVGVCAFTAPGIWSAMNGLGVGGSLSPDLVNGANAILYAFMAWTLSCHRFTFRNFGNIIGGAISLGINHKANHKGKVGYETYLGFIAIQCLGFFFGLLLSNLEKVQCDDGTRIQAPRGIHWRAEAKRCGGLSRASLFYCYYPYSGTLAGSKPILVPTSRHTSLYVRVHWEVFYPPLL
jgi:hypothetical protein